MNEAIKVMSERASVRNYEKGRQLPDETLQQILELAGKAPSAWNLQHWRFIVIKTEEQKEKIFPIAYNQQQVLDASAVILVIGDAEADKSAAEVFAGVPAEARDTLLSNIYGAYKRGRDFGEREALKNASLGAMQLMLAAKALGVDSCPMSGFDHERITGVLDIPDRFIPVMMITLGYAAAPIEQHGRFAIETLVMKEKFEEK
ncbi:nitroreductase family protein [Fictibacillus aquaticus]|uniref:Nitroreductase family protein n=1 Tax=Fictibacillus aquaticus TaxID=2021314 RepID=A0A235FEM8_9BACL|nr:nitroreductase family protein [Fictibacillus aquaticus]OYD59850.1 nitroreductase family protein [Fictibacillus aquaticus]